MSNRKSRLDWQTQDLVFAWKVRSEESEDPFFKFMVLYICLDSLMSAGSNSFVDNQKKLWLKRDEALQGDWANFRRSSTEFANFVEMPGALNMRFPRDESKRISVSQDSTLENCVDFLYQIRCNLFHGQKTPIEPRDFELVSNGWPILDHWVTLLLRKN